VFLVDEAHNLADRARDMYSGEISLAVVIEAQATLQEWEGSAEKALFPHEDGLLTDETDRRYRLSATDLDDLIGTLSRMAGSCAESLVTHADGVKRGASLDRGEPVELCEAVRVLSGRCDRWLRRNPYHPLCRTVDGFSSYLRAFSTSAEYYDRHFVTYVEVEGEDVRVRLVCLDPSGILRPILQRAVSRVLFSATLTPADYFADILGGDRNSVRVSFDSPFPTDHLCVAVADKISTRFEDRDSSYRRVVSYIAATVSAKKGNYMVYFPSYAYMEKTYELFARKYPKVRTVVQKRNMTYAEREAFIAAFTPDSDRLQIGFCVLGGSFSEGVDLPGRCLIGAVIVGVGIPALSSERNIMREYYDEHRDGEGYSYAYVYPGMNHVLQAAGRVIRRPEDRGVVVLLDDRYMGEPYLHLYPNHWEGMAAVGDPTSLAAHLSDFWSRSEDETSS
jgi:Rad3-related DNA helicase